MNKWSFALKYLLIVFIPYVVLFVVTAYTYSMSSDDLSHDLPRILLWVPALISAILPATYAVFVFRFQEHIRSSQSLMLGFFMAFGLLVLAIVTYLVGS